MHLAWRFREPIRETPKRAGPGSTTKLPTTNCSERPGGFEPSHPPWQGGRLPGYIMDADGTGSSLDAETAAKVRAGELRPGADAQVGVATFVLFAGCRLTCY